MTAFVWGFRLTRGRRRPPCKFARYHNLCKLVRIAGSRACMHRRSLAMLRALSLRASLKLFPGRQAPSGPPCRALAARRSDKPQPATEAAPTTATAATVSAIDEPMPPIPRYLGLAGTIPFFTSAGISLFAPSSAPVAVVACQMYGASILSFLGAVHWGVALRSAPSPERNLDFFYSVCPSIGAAAAAVMPPEQGLAVLLPSFGAALVYDATRFAGDAAVPKWYPRLRRPLSVAALASSAICCSVAYDLSKEGADGKAADDVLASDGFAADSATV